MIRTLTVLQISRFRMFWRGNPKTSERAASLPDWPRNGAVLKGNVHILTKPVESCTKWLEVTEYKQAGSSKFVEVPPNVWMVFEQGGLLLHETK
jgi:hypothetical protein